MVDGVAFCGCFLQKHAFDVVGLDFVMLEIRGLADFGAVTVGLFMDEALEGKVWAKGEVGAEADGDGVGGTIIRGAGAVGDDEFAAILLLDQDGTAAHVGRG